MKYPYEELLKMPHHVSTNHPPMSMLDRAAQFAPFSALTGYGEAVAETARLTEAESERGEEEAAELDRRLRLLCAHLEEHPLFQIEYFVPDGRKRGGRYEIRTGAVRKIAGPRRALILEDGTEIKLDRIRSLSGALFDALD